MSKAKHTPGPWYSEFSPFGALGVPQYTIKAGEVGRPIAIVMDSIGGKKGEDGFNTSQKANTARIVACVNAFDGLSDEEIARIPDIIIEGAKAMNERDQLLELLKKMTAFAQEDFKPGFARRTEAYTKAYNDSQELIRKLTKKGGQP